VNWLREVRGIPAELLRFELAQVPLHLTPRLAIIEDGKELSSGTDIADLRRRCAARARDELNLRARLMHPAPWRRFEFDHFAETAVLELAQGTITVFPTLVRRGDSVDVRFEWSAAEALMAFRQGAVYLARVMLERQARDLAKIIAADARLLLSAAPFFTRDVLTDLMLQFVFRRACFDEADPPRTRAAFETAVDRARAQLYPSLEQVTAMVGDWFAEARAVRRLLDDPRARSHASAVEEAHAHLRRLFTGASLESMSADWLRQMPRYLKAEERRWERVLARGSESPQIARELLEWAARHQALENQMSAELRRPPQLDELRLWIEEYRVSLYAQELKTLGPVSASRLEERVQEITAWIAR
jgi:ATP-dependent helicase HrpA